MKTRTMVAAGAIAASLVGGAAGALLFTPDLSGAQETTTTTATAPPGTGLHGRDHGGPGLAAAATAIGISEADLRAALASGKTIAAVAQDHGVEVQKVIDAMVAEAKAKLDALATALPDRIAAIVNGVAPLGRPDGPGRGRGFGLGAGLDAAAGALGVSTSDLEASLRSGSSIADVAKDKGVDLQKVIDAMVAAATTRIDQAVTDGKLDRAAATKLEAGLTDQITAIVNGQRPAFGPGGHRGERGFGGGPAGPEGTTGTQGASYTS
jgi:uncharacterized protein (DUF433 family)